MFRILIDYIILILFLHQNHSFYDTPILSVKDIVIRTGIADKTTRNMLELMLEEGLIKEMTGYGRNKLFIFEKYFNLFK